MSASNILRCCASVTGRRFINQSARRLESKASDGIKNTASSTASSSSTVPRHSESVVGPKMKIPTDFEKWILVWMKKFPKGQVPERITEDLMYQTKSRARVKAANYMILFSALACLAAAISGKRAAKSGDSIQKRNLEWHKKNKEEYDTQMQQAKS
ncbi:UPF0389 protein CG9231 [Nasonia vitripennis]|uniref:Uncharacterized protein n=1 Tax=Nasonia vitripennis TaxID=7425 RepID=A0A7M7G364_NASVI|nr:UPF0389 protein CG9231 [Nasonia vitripennis]